MSLSTVEAHAGEVKFIGLYGTVGFVAIWKLSLLRRQRIDLGKTVWSAIDEVIWGFKYLH